MKLLLFVAVLVATLGMSACAKKAAPSGGPVDDIAPQVVSAYPDSFATLVPRDTTLHITFTEKIDAETLDRTIWVSPESIIIKSISRKDFTLVVKFRDSLPESATVSVLLGTSLADRRGNTLKDPHQWTFSTGSVIDPGTISGTVQSGDQARGQKATRILVGVFTGVGEFADRTPVAVTETQTSGSFALRGLPLSLGTVQVVAYVDADGNYLAQGRREFYSAKFETLSITSEVPVHQVSLRLVNPESPGTVTGLIARAAEDSTAIGIELYPAQDDSLSEAAASVKVQPQGGFVLSAVPAGAYRLVAYCDANQNNFRDLLESWMVWDDTLRVSPGDTTRMDTLNVMNCKTEN